MIEDCATCRFFMAQPQGSGGSGDCRRHAPVVTPFTEANGLGEQIHMPITSWPQVGEANWCGDFEESPSIAEENARLERATAFTCDHCEDGASVPQGLNIGDDCTVCHQPIIPF